MNQIQADQAKLRKLTHKIDAIDITKKLLSIRQETSSQHVIPPSSELFLKKKNEKKRKRKIYKDVDTLPFQHGSFHLYYKSSSLNTNKRK